MTHTPLVAIKQADYDNVDINLAYASPDNVTKIRLYDPQKMQACLHPDAVKCLKKASILASQQKYRLLILDAFRPRAVQWALWHFHPDERFVAHPSGGSPHSRGVAIDITLLDDHSQPVDMGTPFDDFTPKSYHGCTEISRPAQANRYALLGIMVSAGWDFYINEWWHYQLFNSKDYPLYENCHLKTNFATKQARQYAPS